MQLSAYCEISEICVTPLSMKTARNHACESVKSVGQASV